MICGYIFMGRVLKIVGVVILVLVVLIVGVGFYFYNYYVFKSLRVCVGEGVDSGVPCNSSEYCVGLVEENGLDVDLSEMPDFVNENFRKIVGDVVYCDGNCYMKNIRGLDFETGESEMLGGCEDGEFEFVVEIRGKEGIEILKWLRARG